MQERYEFRLFPTAAPIITGEPVPRGAVAAIVRGRVGDEQYLRVGHLHKQLRQLGKAGAFAGWSLSRTFTAAEKDRATAFLVDPPIHTTSLEDGGTSYDEQDGCSECGIGGTPRAPIFAQTLSFRGQDVVRLLSGEILISEKFLNLLRNAGCSGADVQPVTRPARNPNDRIDSTCWLLLPSDIVHIDRRLTRFGADPFDHEQQGGCQCAAGEIAGYAQLSPLKLSSNFAPDLALSDVYVGTRRGLLRPYRLLLLSRRILQLAQAAELRGLRTEPVFAVPSQNVS